MTRWGEIPADTIFAKPSTPKVIQWKNHPSGELIKGGIFEIYFPNEDDAAYSLWEVTDENTICLYTGRLDDCKRAAESHEGDPT